MKDFKDMRILIADDNLDFCNTIADLVSSLGYEPYAVQSPEEAMSYLDKHHKRISIVLLDIEFTPVSNITGIDVLKHIKVNYPELPVIMISGKGTIELAVQATKFGAINFIEKNILSKDKLQGVLSTAAEKFAIEGDAKEIRNFLSSNGIIGKSTLMQELGLNIVKYGRTNLNVLITGATGTGKKLVAKALHSASPRTKSPFVHCDIPNIQRELFQSELFGHVRGAFTGASDSKKGLFHKANTGTLFLDEIGALSLDLQANLLIPIEEKNIRKVGSNQTEEVDVRFISATDRDLPAAIRESQFREQLYHRLRECEIQLPTLNERQEDIPEIVQHYVAKFNEENKLEKLISPSAIEFLQEQSWSGNVRQLMSLIKVVLHTERNDFIEVAEIKKAYESYTDLNPVEQKQESSLKGSSLQEILDAADKEAIEQALDESNGNVSKAAVQLGVSRETLHLKIKKYDIKTEVFRKKKR
ncbi:MAG: sigma-54-dependent Fis family transcriptional regulator [Ignavibacteria bacterium]|nr:sigma-54-dependent Fis family transcriptional regulator [Ignavibacteria bacterium]